MTLMVVATAGHSHHGHLSGKEGRARHRSQGHRALAPISTPGATLSIVRGLRRAGGGTAMEMRVFGRTGMQLSVLGFGCGAVGGLMVRGDPLDQERTIARAITAGVNYFDTAVQYGNGESEKNLGRVL